VASIGAAEVVEGLDSLTDRVRGRFTPAEILVRMARASERFYPASGHPLP
jgi:hypothetical protein